MEPRRATWSVAGPIHDLEYADGTLHMALTTMRPQNIVSAFEHRADLYGMKSKHSKMELLFDPRYPQPRAYFNNGVEVPATTQAEYLGSQVSWKDIFS